jgi:hypothetical protein
MTMDVYPRAWNLFTGLALVSGCSGRTISSDGDSTDSINDGETTLNPDSPDSSSDTSSDSGPDTGTPECYDDVECGYGFYCYDGICEYAPQHDGHYPDYDCYEDYECGELGLCEFNYCQSVYYPPQCDFGLLGGPTLEIPDQALALAFIDVDQDGAEELVVATQTQLHVYENGAFGPVSHARGEGSPSVDAMVGGDFDGNPGSDVMLLHDDELDMHASDGLGNLLSALPTPSPYPSLRGLEAGEVDAQPLTDLLAWGSETSGIYYGNGSAVGVVGGDVTSGSVRELGLLNEGFTLLSGNQLWFADVNGLVFGSVFLRGDSPHAQASIDSFGAPLEAGTSIIDDWTLVEVYDRSSLNQTGRWGLPTIVMHARAGDLEGLDENDELALILDDGNLLLMIGGQCLLPVPLDGAAIELAFGDHDGDGDDELAVLTSVDTISIIDVE